MRSVENYMCDERSALLMHAKRVWDRELVFKLPGPAIEGGWVERGRGRVRVGDGDGKGRGELVY